MHKYAKKFSETLQKTQKLPLVFMGIEYTKQVG